MGPYKVPAIFKIAGKGDSDWGYAWIPMVGPICGGIVAIDLCSYILSNNINKSVRCEDNLIFFTNLALINGLKHSIIIQVE